jgi:hypothetical protein
LDKTHPRIVGIHLDLKYQMPKKSYLLSWLKRLPQLGINTLLVEYEDKFPFSKYPFLRADGAFTPAELKKFLSTARAAGLRVIPLVQTLSHLEFALAHDELASLREAPDVPTQICPSNPNAVAFVKDLLTEVLGYHEQDEFFHIGGDEAWLLGTCPTCAKRVQDDKLPLWAEHIGDILRFVIERGKKPIVWDDALWNTPEKVTCLPKEAILHNWNYGVTSPPEAGKLPFPQVDVYKAAGYEVVGGPCLNQGILVPAKNHCLANTAIWGKKVRATDILGLINTAWACFHVPLPVTWMEIAATGALFDEDTDINEAWEVSFLRREFGTDAAALPQALEKLGRGWALRVEGLARPLAAGVYGYTDMVAWYPGAQTERRKRGAYPLDWNEVDFARLYLKKLAFYRAAPDKQTIHAKINELTQLYDEARSALRELTVSARAHQREARLLAVLADLRWLSMRVLSHLLRSDSDTEALRRQWMALKPALVETVAPFLEPVSVARMLTIWWDPAMVALSAAPFETKAIPQEHAAAKEGEPEF